jgi:outer membrane protein assembly factor BamB
LPFQGSFLLNYTPTVVAHDDVILCLTYKQLCAFSSASGKKLWERKGAVGFASAGDLFVIDGLVWTIPMVRFGAPVPWKKTDFLGDSGQEFWGLDLYTGDVKKRVNRSILPGVHHHRCYRNKATEDFLVYGQGGLEFMDLHGDDHSGNLWTRGICQYGVMPANGYIYVPPHPCQCFSQDMLHGFHVLAASNSTARIVLESDLQKGPAFSDTLAKTPRLEVPIKQSGQVWQPPVTYGKPDEWPMFRRDITRSGSSTCKISGPLQQTWQAKLGSDLTAVTVADGRLFVYSKAEQMLYCLNAASGHSIWRLATPGKIDSPPTIVNDLCVFGSVDGSVYCVRATDGALRWRFRISKDERRTVVDDCLESIWPIHGSVLVLQGTVYFAAGRSSHLDGGIRLFAVDLASGKVKHQATLDSDGEGANRVLTNVDLLVADGKMINMGLAQYDRHLNLQPTSVLNTLICDTGFLGDAWFHRENWVLGGVTGTVSESARTTMATQPRSERSSVGKLLVFNATTAYGIKNPYSWQKYANTYPTHTGHVHEKYARYESQWFPIGTRIFSFENAAATSPTTPKNRRRDSREHQTNEKWGVDMPFQPRAVALAGETLVLAGWLDAVAIQPKTGLPLNPANPDPRDCVLRTLSTSSGNVLGNYPIPAEPVYDGLAVAYGRVYLPLQNGTVICLQGSDQTPATKPR